MPETLTRLSAFEIDRVCDTCGKGKMRSTGAMLASSPPKYPHICDTCGEQQTFLTRYPYIRHVKDEEIVV